MSFLERKSGSVDSRHQETLTCPGKHSDKKAREILRKMLLA